MHAICVEVALAAWRQLSIMNVHCDLSGYPLFAITNSVRSLVLSPIKFVSLPRRHLY